MKWLHDMLTEVSGESLSIVRVLALAGFAEYLGLAAAEFWRTSHFQMQEFGIGMGAVIAAVGVALKLGEKDKPEGTNSAA